MPERRPMTHPPQQKRPRFRARLLGFLTRLLATSEAHPKLPIDRIAAMPGKEWTLRVTRTPMAVAYATAPNPANDNGPDQSGPEASDSTSSQ
jgi:hypothetical protein